MKLTSYAAGGLTAAAITIAAALLPAAALASPAMAATAGSAAGHRPAPPVTVYVANYGSGTVTPIRAATNRACRSPSAAGPTSSPSPRTGGWPTSATR